MDTNHLCWSLCDLIATVQEWRGPLWLNVAIDPANYRNGYVVIALVPGDEISQAGCSTFDYPSHVPLTNLHGWLDLLVVMRECQCGWRDHDVKLRTELLIAETRYIRMMGKIERNIAVRRAMTKSSGRRNGVGILAGVLGWLGVL